MVLRSQFFLAFLGGCAGLSAGTVVLRARGALRPGTFMALLLAWMGLLIGVRLQYRLENMPLLDAVAMTPTDLVSSGWRLPLGLVLGAAMALVWCVACGLPTRATGDALAVAASTLIPFARLGCLAAGCCMGGVCGRWAIPWLCLRVGPQSEAFHRQVADGLIAPESLLSLPAHALPIYFALASLATLGVLVWLLRRRAPAGLPLLVFGIVWPITKLALERMRATPRPSPMMTAIPLAMLAVTVAVGLAVALRRRASRQLSPAPILSRSEPCVGSRV